MTQRESHAPNRGEAEPTGAPVAVQLLPFFFAEDRDGIVVDSTTCISPPPPEHGTSLLDSLLACQPHDLPAPQPFAPTNLDGDLDTAQRNALCRALHTPDICLVQGLPGTGKSLVASRLLAHCLSRGERVLLLSASPAGVDQILDLLPPGAPIRAVRGLDPDEDVDALPPAVRDRTIAGRRRFFDDQVLLPTRQALLAAKVRREARAGDAAILEQLGALVERLDMLAEAEENLQRRRTALLDTPTAISPIPDTSPLQVGQGACDRVAALRMDQERIRAELESIRAERAGLPATATRHTGLWGMLTGTLWRNTSTQTSPRAEQILARENHLLAELARIDTEVAAAAQADPASVATAQPSSPINTERDRLLRELDAEAAQLRADRATTLADWQKACQGLGSDTPPPAGPTAAALEETRAACQRLRLADEQAGEWAQRQADAADKAGHDLVGKLSTWANLVAIPVGGLSCDPLVGDASPQIAFDRLILDEADRVTETDFRAAARRASRWVLFGDPDDHSQRFPGPGRPGRSTNPRIPFFQRLWQHLHPDPRQLPRTWRLRQGRLSCSLRPISLEQERWIQTETLVDRPEVELRILSVPYEAPELVEVLFPGQTPLTAAKAYLFQELEEPTVQTLAPCLSWREESDQILLLFGAASEPGTMVVQLAKGLREFLAPSENPEANGGLPCHTTALAFDRAAGWDRARAEDWVVQHLGLRDQGRTAYLTVPHRYQPALASLLSALLYEGGRLVCSSRCVPLEFISVPSHDDSTASRRRDVVRHSQHGGTATVLARTRPARGGAGFETDLTDIRCPDELPADLRCLLPVEGFVNLEEAQTLIGTLENLMADAAFRTDARAWQRRSASAPDPRCTNGERPGNRRPAVAVIALYPAQAALLRRLLARNLPTCPLDVEVGLPEDFRQRECFAALVSLTRSHTHRAVAYGSGPDALCLALARAASLLLIFGDTGTLSRRAQWQGAVEHLDDSAAAREREFAARLLELAHANGRGM